MIKKLVLAAIVVVPATVHADPKMKPGLWEVRLLKQVVDGQDLTARIAGIQVETQRAIANMPSQQRKQIEAKIGKQTKAGTEAHHVCVSPEMAARDNPVVAQDAGCQPAKVERSGNKISFSVNCVNDGRTVVGTGDSVFADDAVSTKLDIAIVDVRGRHTMQSEVQMNYLGPDCGGLKPVDQAAK